MYNTKTAFFARKKLHIVVRHIDGHNICVGLHGLHNNVNIIICDNAQYFENSSKGVEKQRQMVYYIYYRI